MASATKLDVSRSVDLYEEAVRLMPGGSQTKGKRPKPRLLRRHAHIHVPRQGLPALGRQRQ